MQSRSQEVASSVLANCFTRVCFRLGDSDAEKFERGFSFFDKNDLQNLGVGEAIGRVERAEYDFNLKTYLLPELGENEARETTQKVIAHSRLKYAQEKEEVEKEIRKATRPIKTKAILKTKPIVTKVEEAVPTTKVLETTETQVPTQKLKEQEKPHLPKRQKEAVSPNIPKDVPTSAERNEHQDKGNSQHRYLQSLIKRMAESAGFKVTLEKQIFGGAGRVDLAFERKKQKIACEVSVTNTPQYELKNIQKCLASNYSPVLMVSSKLRHLKKIKALAKQELEKEDFKEVLFLSPDEVHAFFEEFEDKNDDRVKGFKVNVKLKPVEESERASRKKAISEVILKAEKDLKKSDKNK